MTEKLTRVLVWTGVLSVAIGAGSARTVAAQGATAQKSPGSGKQCVVQGKTHLPTSLEIMDSAVGGNPVARFTGIETDLAAMDFPATPGGRVHIRTGTGTGSFRIEGYVDSNKIPLVTKHEIPIVSGHVWMGKQRRVEFVQASPGKLKVRQRILYPMNQTFVAWASCSSFTLTQGTPPGFNVPGHARGYVSRKDEITLFDDYGRDRNEVTTLFNSGGSGILFWSEKQRGGFVHVQHSADVVIDAWARRRDLKALPRGETMDQAWRGRVTRPAPPRLKVAGNPDVVKTTKEVPLRIKASDKAPVIGRIEADTEVLVIDRVVGYASVLPKSLSLAPPGEHHFWADAKELGIAK